MTWFAQKLKENIPGLFKDLMVFFKCDFSALYSRLINQG